MTHNTSEQWLRELAARSSTAPPPAIDVTDSVMSSIHDMRHIAIPLDRTSLIVGGITVATAASLVIALLPSLTTMTQPWISFWLL
jgi:hypothetical protein